MKRLVPILALLACFGCVTMFGPKMDFPSSIKSVCRSSKHEAKRRIESKGLKLKEKWNCRVYTKQGERKFQGIWAWKDPGWKMYVCGLCNGKEIWIGVSPHNGQEVHVPTLIHEFAHYWLMSNYSDYTHNPILDDVIFNWKHGRDVADSVGIKTIESIRRVYDNAADGEIISFNTVENGQIVHYDCIAIKDD